MSDDEIPACGQCGSTALHQVVFGKPTTDLLEDAARRPELLLGGCCLHPGDWSRECVSCGQRRYLADDYSQWTTSPRPRTAELVTRYAGSARAALGTETAPAISYAGLWLLLAHLAPVAEGAMATAVADAIGIAGEDAAALAAELLAAPHPTIATALGAWSRLAQKAPLAVDIDPMPDQAGLDRWAAEHTRGLIARFPVEVSPDTLLIVATALVLQPRWLEELHTDDDGMLVLDDGLQTLVDTRAAGLVAVAKPFSADGVDVISVIAAPEVPPADVWRAADEVAAQLNRGALWHGGYPADLTDGHAWTVREVTESFLAWDAPADTDVRWRSRLPRWTAATDRDLTEAPGIAAIAAALAEADPQLDGPVQCRQIATAAYDESGFTAAAVTAFGVTTGAPEFVERTVRRVEITFGRPHALIAIARGGPWEGVPVFHAWVTPGG